MQGDGSEDGFLGLVVRLVGGIGGLGRRRLCVRCRLVRDAECGHELGGVAKVGGRHTLPAGVSWLHDLWVLHGVGVDVINAVHRGATHLGEFGIELAELITSGEVLHAY